jgi:hypothetical protein
VASITTRVTPSSANQSTMTSNDRVIVENDRTSCARRPGLPWLGTRTQQVSSALPISNAATRSMISSVSCVSSSTLPSPVTTANGRLPAGAARRQRI